jgi:uncharacterized protein YbjT (DUF2867 family)
MNSKILITGANGHIGKKLIRALGDAPLRALVRSASAQADLQDYVQTLGLTQAQVVICDYLDREAMTAAARDCDYAVHLVGIIKESGTNTFQRAHVDTTIALLEALAQSDIRRICYLSLLGAAPDSSNACFASRAQAENMLMTAHCSALVLRIPMVLGEDDYASRALLAKARAKRGLTFRGESLEQPIYAGDVVRAIVTDIEKVRAGAAPDSRLLELAGPESLSRKELIQRAAHVLGTRTKTLSLPLGLGLAMAWLLEQTSRSPPVSRAMLQILDHDDAIDPLPGCTALGLTLTPLDETLALCAGANTPPTDKDGKVS